MREGHGENVLAEEGSNSNGDPREAGDGAGAEHAEEVDSRMEAVPRGGVVREGVHSHNRVAEAGTAPSLEEDNSLAEVVVVVPR